MKRISAVVVAIALALSTRTADAQMQPPPQPTCLFIQATPSAGPGKGNVSVSVTWSNCPAAGNTVEAALFQVMGPGFYKALSTKNVNGVGASGAKGWVFTAASGIPVVANISVYDQTGLLITSVTFTPVPPAAPITVP